VQLILAIPVLIALVFSTAFALLRLAGVSVHVADPVTAGAIAALAGMLGAIVPLREQGDALAIVKSALLGTVVHLLVSTVLTVAAVAAHVVNGRGQFLFWAVAGYWISIFTLIWLARRIVTAKTLKAQH